MRIAEEIAALRSEVERGFREEVTENGEPYAQRDLNAQEDMAFWALVMALAAVGTFFISTYVALIVKRTLEATAKAAEHAKTMADEARKATKAARGAVRETQRIGGAQTRAYLSVIRADVHIDRTDRLEPKFPAIEVFLHFHNSGGTPAVNVSYYCTAGVSKWRDIEHPTNIEIVPYHKFINNIPPGGHGPVKVTCYGVARDWREVQKRWQAYTNQTPIGEAPVLLIFGVVFYEDVFGDTFRSQFHFWLEEQPMPNRTIKGRDDLPTIQARIPTFERIPDRMKFIKPPSDDT